MVSETYVLKDEFNPDAFLADVKAAKAAVGEATEADAKHLQGLVLTTNVLVYGGQVLVFLGTAQAWGLTAAACCLLGATMIAISRCMKWTIIGHHVSHGGYDKLQKSNPDVLAPHYKRGIFAVGFRRVLDWMDWMLPEAWDAEHNKMHHYYLSEEKDPDLVERNFELLQGLPIPMFLKYVSMIMWVFTWKFTYYSPSTFKELQLARKNSWVSQNWPKGRKTTEPVTIFQFFQNPVEALLKGALQEVIFWFVFSVLWLCSIMPMACMVALPAVMPLALNAVGAWPFATAASQASVRALGVAVLAEFLTNAHSFVIIACNHSGEDLYRYDTSCKAYSAEWFCRCAYSSANFETGNDFIDGMYGWLNYQVEHHMFPDMTPLQYRKLQPLMKSLCKKHGVMYIQQNALKRTWQMFRVAVGDAKMHRCTALIPPQAAEANKEKQNDVSPMGVDETLIGG